MSITSMPHVQLFSPKSYKELMVSFNTQFLCIILKNPDGQLLIIIIIII